MASSNVNTQFTLLHVSYVRPSFDSPDLDAEFFLPLTFFDIFWFKFPPVERIFFYKYDGLTLDRFNSEIVPRLKHSLSLTLSHFLPLAGNLTWQDKAPVPSILYSPNDAVLVKIAESDADFGVVSSKIVREAALSRPYVPELPTSDAKASTIALQITLFPNQGFCIGITSHHAVLDGKSSIMFLKAWAYMCKHSENEKRPCLPPEFTPFMDRKVIKDPERLDIEFLNLWLGHKFPGMHNPRSFKLMPSIANMNESVRGTFVLSREDIRKLRNMVISELSKDDDTVTESLHLSTFVLSFAYAAVCEAKVIETEKEILFGFTADCRARLEPPIHGNYFGNCVTGCAMEPNLDSEVILLKNIVHVVKRFSELIKGLDEEVLGGLKEKVSGFFMDKPGSRVRIGVAGSIKFGVYEIDFGWGRPVLVEITSIGRTAAVSMAESREGNGGVEIGVVMQKHEMEKFVRLFVDGIKV